MIWVDEQYRGKGVGKQVVLFWEDKMKQKGFKTVMTSTLANEEAQHFYRKLGTGMQGVYYSKMSR